MGDSLWHKITAEAARDAHLAHAPAAPGAGVPSHLAHACDDPAGLWWNVLYGAPDGVARAVHALVERSGREAATALINASDSLGLTPLH